MAATQESESAGWMMTKTAGTNLQVSPDGSIAAETRIKSLESPPEAFLVLRTPYIFGIFFYSNREPPIHVGFGKEKRTDYF